MMHGTINIIYSIKMGILRTYHIYIPIYYGLLTWITTSGTNRVLWSFTAIYTVFMAWLTFSWCIIFAGRTDCCTKRAILYILTISAVAWPWSMTCWVTFLMAQHTHIGCCFVHPVQKKNMDRLKTNSMSSTAKLFAVPKHENKSS